MVKEVVFLNKNAERWKEAEKLISVKKNANPDYYAALFIQITDDLAYAKTYFPKSPTEQYLNSLASKIHRAIYRTKKEPSHRFASFWKVELPQELFRIRKYILYSFIILLVSFLIGWISAENDNEYSRIILGDAYVNQTLDNIENGDPMGIYKDRDSLSMFFFIAYNNIKVMFSIFLLGIAASFGSIVYIFMHGVMLAGFFHMFFEHSVLSESLITVWIHGTIEIFTLVVSGGIGIMLGNSLLFPETYSRKKSFIKAARRGVKVVTGLVPFIIAAAFLESFVTRHTEWNNAVRIGIIVLSATVIIWYFFIYPKKVNSKLKSENYDKQKTERNY